MISRIFFLSKFHCHFFRGVAVSTTCILSCRPYSTLCTNVITFIFLVNMHSNLKTTFNQLFLFHHTNIKIKAQTYTVTHIITATPVEVKQKSNIYIVIIETFQEQEQTRKQSLLGGLHQFNIESKNEREQTRNCSN